MRFKSTVTTEPEAALAAESLCAEVQDYEPDLAVLFTSHHYDPDFQLLLSGVYERINARNLIGCAAEGIIGPCQELERQPAAVLWVAEMPGTRVLPFILDYADLQNLNTPEAMRDRIGIPLDDCPCFIALPDPFSIPAEGLLERLGGAFPGAPIVGGMASGAETIGQTRLFLNDQVLRQGAVGVSLTGDVGINTIVSQGCRPVGKPYIITECQDNLITKLADRSAYDVLNEVYGEASAEEQKLMQNSIYLGRAVPGSPGPSDFLVRNVLGVVGGKAIAIGDHPRQGQIIQFHVQDAETADRDLRLLLRSQVVDQNLSPAGGLLFNCNGRGARLFGKPDHDIKVVNELVGSCQVAGFFAAGEIGPLGDETYVHGLTSSLALFTSQHS
ncbi:MAG: FIST C-terminal domain-containing protein [Phycisphaerae bacterium]|nr:FIST C-terminal domain-containing protein [Phycisphaerae bacterium]